MKTELERPALESLDELSLAARIAGGDTAAFELLMRRYNRRLYRLALRLARRYGS
jgi:RNA polymerase sigma-70 factor (ECF subfamily)